MPLVVLLGAPVEFVIKGAVVCAILVYFLTRYSRHANRQGPVVVLPTGGDARFAARRQHRGESIVRWEAVRQWAVGGDISAKYMSISVVVSEEGGRCGATQLLCERSQRQPPRILEALGEATGAPPFLMLTRLGRGGRRLNRLGILQAKTQSSSGTTLCRVALEVAIFEKKGNGRGNLDRSDTGNIGLLCTRWMSSIGPSNYRSWCYAGSGENRRDYRGQNPRLTWRWLTSEKTHVGQTMAWRAPGDLHAAVSLNSAASGRRTRLSRRTRRKPMADIGERGRPRSDPERLPGILRSHVGVPARISRRSDPRYPRSSSSTRRCRSPKKCCYSPRGSTAADHPDA